MALPCPSKGTLISELRSTQYRMSFKTGLGPSESLTKFT